MEQSVVIPPGILSTCHAGSRRRPFSCGAGLSDGSAIIHGGHNDGRRVISLLPPTREDPEGQRTGSEPSSSAADGLNLNTTDIPSTEVQKAVDHNADIDQSQPLPVAVDFAQSRASDNPGVDREKRQTTITVSPVPEDEESDGQRSSYRTSRVFRRLSHVAQGFTKSYHERRSGSIGGRSFRNSFRFSTIFFRPSDESRDVEDRPKATMMRKRDSKAIPKSWKFLGIDAFGVGDAVSDAANKLRPRTSHAMYEKAKIRQKQLRRSKTAQLMFRYTFYLLLVTCVYLVLVGLPLWRGAVWYMYILFEKHLVLKAGLTITFGLGFLYAYSPLLINFEPTSPTPESDEGGHSQPSNSDTALVIPCYKSEQLIGATLEAALKIFPKESIFVVANGNSPEPLDNTASVCDQYDVSHTWSPLGSKIIAQFVGCYVARRFLYVLLIDDDCLLPPNLPIVSDRMRGNVKCIGYIMKSVGTNGSPGTLCQQAQDLEYKLSGLAKAFAGKVGSVTFPHGCIVLWDRELLIRTFENHPGFSVSEDWFFGHAARQLGSRITMCTSTFVKTETPNSVFFSGGGARGGFGEMTIWKQRFYRWNYFFVTGMYYDLSYILFDWKLGWWEIGAKIFVFQEIYETLLYLLAPFVIPISFATRPVFCSYIYGATIALYIGNAFLFNYIHLRSRNQTVSFKAFLYYIPFKWVLGFVNIASCYYAIWTYATYFAKRHPKIIEDDKAVEIVLRLEQKDTYVSEKGEIEDLNELMYKIAKPCVTDAGKRQSVIKVGTRFSVLYGP